MKTITSAVLGLSLTLASAGLSLAAQDTKTAAPATAQTDSTKSAPVVKKHKKSAKKAKTATPATTDAKSPAPTK